MQHVKKIEQKDQEYLAAVQAQQDRDLDQLPPEERKQRLQQLQEKAIENNLLVYHEQEVARRHEECLQIEKKDAKEILAMFQDIQALIHEQQAGIDVISEHLENAHVQASQAEQELVESEKLQKKARKKHVVFYVFFLLLPQVLYLLYFLE